MAFKVSINLDECIGCGACTSCANFEMTEVNGEPKAKVKKASVEDAGCNQEAADNCPTGAIRVNKG